MREHPDRPVRQQGGREEPAGEGQDGDLPQEEEPPVLRDLCQEQLQLREAFPLPCKEALRVTNFCRIAPPLSQLFQCYTNSPSNKQKLYADSEQ